MNGKCLAVLIVEDNPGDAFMIKEMLNDLKLDLKVTVVKDGQEALDVLSDGRGILPDLVILDLNLPKVDGFDVLKYMKARQKLNPIPVVVMTGSSRIEDEKRSRQLGAADYCIKPATLDEMDGTVLSLRRNLELLPPKGKSVGSDVSRYLEPGPFVSTFGEKNLLLHGMDRTIITFHNSSQWDSWK